MKAFNVRISGMDSASRLRVEGLENTNWLLRRLSDYFVFKTSDPLLNVSDTSDYTFHVMHSSQITSRQFERILMGISEAKVIVEPQAILAVG
jgi:hypothetical protein